jgi:transposase
MCEHPYMERRHGCPQPWQEARRKRAFALKPHGWKQGEMAAALGVSPAAVSQGLAKGRAHGGAAGRAKPRPTGPNTLPGDHWRLIPERLSHGAAADGLRGEGWPGARGATVSGEACGPWDHKAHVSRLWKRLPWTPQMPLARAPNAMKPCSSLGVGRAGPSSTTGARRRPDQRVGGRVRVFSRAGARPHVCPLRPDPDPAVAIDTPACIGDARDHAGRPTRHDEAR